MHFQCQNLLILLHLSESFDVPTGCRLQEFLGQNSQSAPTRVFQECGIHPAPHLPAPEMKIVRDVGTSDLTWSRLPPILHLEFLHFSHANVDVSISVLYSLLERLAVI